LDRRVGLGAQAATLLVLLFGLLVALPVLSGPTRADALPAAAATDGLIVTTRGSTWYHWESRWRYPAFEPFADRLDVVTTIPLDQLLDQSPDLHLARDESRWFTYTLDAPVAESLVFDLRGSSKDFDGLQVNLWVREPTRARFGHFDRTYERSWHLDQPVVGEYQVELEARRQSTCTLQIGTGQSPFLATPLDGYAFVALPDIDPLSDREIGRIEQFVQSGGNLLALAEHIRAESYYSSSNFPALNELLDSCGMQLTGDKLATVMTTTANCQTINVLTDIRPHPLTEGIIAVTATGTTLDLTGGAQGLVFDDAGDPVIAVSRNGLGQCLAVGTMIGFNADFHLEENDRLAANIVEWASKRMSYRAFLPLTVRKRQ